MQTEQKNWTQESGWEVICDHKLKETAQFVLVFGSREVLKDKIRFDEIREFYPNAEILLGSTAGEIQDINVSDESIVCTAVKFDKTKLQTSQINIGEVPNSFSAGKKLADDLPKEDLIHVIVLSDGLKVNGTQLAAGLNKNLPENVSVTGGLAGDGADFCTTLVGLNEVPSSGTIAAVGLYGSSLRVGYGSVGGWDSFGPERLITKSKDNVLYELDDESALDLYKKYLGEQAAGLPATGLLFPLSIRTKKGKSLVRTILAVDEETKSMTFAGDMPEGSFARLMKANFDRLVDGASSAAEDSYEKINSNPDLAILISCVGRKLVLGQRIEEEVEGVKDILGENATITGFYSYGEISPFVDSMNCQLHNQTMTVTTFTEK
jgi:hypothetical protein